ALGRQCHRQWVEQRGAGAGSKAERDNTVAVGTAIGWNSWADAADATALGRQCHRQWVEQRGAGAGSKAERDNTVAVGTA
ncbi:hypothetical protein C7E18_23485, partial [Stenotrophomonas maltophilia]